MCCVCTENALLAAATEHAVCSGLGRGEFGGYFNNLRALNQTFVPISKLFVALLMRTGQYVEHACQSAWTLHSRICIFNHQE